MFDFFFRNCVIFLKLQSLQDSITEVSAKRHGARKGSGPQPLQPLASASTSRQLHTVPCTINISKEHSQWHRLPAWATQLLFFELSVMGWTCSFCRGKYLCQKQFCPTSKLHCTVLQFSKKGRTKVHQVLGKHEFVLHKFH